MSGIPGIAIIGMAGRFPRAASLGELWRNLAAGVDCIRDFTDEELPGVSPEVLADPNYIKARGVLEGPELFDARLFDMTPRQAEVTDPQHRLFLECAHEALEDAGCDPERYRGSIGVFGGVSLSSYFLGHILTNPAVLQSAGGYQIGLGTDRDYLTTLVSYKLNLRGPSLNVQTACSTSLVAVVLACQSLLAYACDLALAGGASVKLPQQAGYLYHPGGFDSQSGRCRSFDARADGAVTGAGAGVVLLKRLDEALEDGDPIRAVILGSAFNNDGSARVGFTAPGVEGQAEVVTHALSLAGIDPETVTYVECHGSATPLGDPIEIAALTKAFRANGARGKGFCAVGSVKSNIGHAAAAAGIAGLIKTILALEHGEIPPSLHFEEPNPRIDFAESPFYVNTKLSPWPNGAAPRRAGVSSFGLGGTNAHALLEEAPPPEPSGPSRAHQLLLLSAAAEPALEEATGNLAAHLERSSAPLADVAFTLQTGRRELPYRRVLVCREGEAPALLADRHPRRVLSAVAGARPPVAFLLPGVGDHYPGMAWGLYETEPTFRAAFDECADLFQPFLGEDLRRLVFTGGRQEGESSVTPDLKAMLGQSVAESGPLDRVGFSQPAVFSVEVALAALWAEWGIRPEALLGYSLGEYTAAHLAGVWTLPDAVRLVAERSFLLEMLPAGAMLAVPLPPDELAARAGALGLDLAAVNHHQMGVVAGEREAVLRFADQLGEEGIPARLLPGTIAAHSRALAPAVPALHRLLAGIPAQTPRLPLVSNVTGTWLDPKDAVDPAYWIRHLTGTVRFAQGLATLWENPGRVLLEVGPGFGLSTLSLQSAAGGGGERLALPSLPHRDERQPDTAFLLGALGRLWLAGVSPDWDGFYRHERRRCVRLPTYPFQRERFWVDPGPGFAPVAQGAILGEYEAARAEEPAPSVPAPVPHSRRLETPFVPPATPLEERIARLAGDLLGIAKVGRHDGFFELGGNSITAAMLVNRLQEGLAAEVAVAAVFEAPSAAELAALLERELPQAVAAAFQAERERPRDAAWEPIAAGDWEPGATAPLSFAQERLWFLDRLDGTSAHYNIPAGLRFGGRLSWPALVTALSGIVERHTALRTTFAEIEGEARQVIGRPFALWPARVDLTALPAGRREPEARRAAAAFSAIPYRLETGPLLHGALLRLAEEDHAAVFTMHHIVSDGWSVGVFANELSALYGAVLAGEPSPLPPLPVQYADYALWQRKHLSGETLALRLAFFREALAGVPPLEIATDRPRPPVQTFRGAAAPLLLPAGTTARLGDLARRHGASPFMAYLTGLAAVLGRWSGQEDFAVGTPVAGRHRAQLEGLIGFFVNTLALRQDLAGDPEFSTLLGRVRETTVAAYAHQDVPFEKVVGELRPERDLSRTPVFQVLFVLQNAPAGTLELPEVQLSGFAAGFVAARFDLTFTVSEGPFGLSGALDYNTDLFDAPTAARLAAHWQAALSAVSEEPGLAVSALPLLSPGERFQVLSEWADGGPAPAPGDVLHLFHESAARTPEAPALLFEGRATSYFDLAVRAYALARGLAAAGLAPGDRVALLVERTPDLVAAILGIWQVGGAYVPFDPAYPAERLALMLEDSGAAVLLVQESLLSLAEKLGGAAGGQARVLVLESAAGTPASVPAGTAPELPAYVIYTSGSTGRPKGVVAGQRGLAAFTRAMVDLMVLKPGDRVLQFASPSFDASAVQLFPPLAAGATLVLHRNPAELSTGELLDFAASRGVTVIDLPAAVWRGALNGWASLSPVSGEGGRGDEGLPLSFRLYMTGGESLSRETLARWAALAAPGARFVGSYGPTETTVTAAVVAVDRDVAADLPSVNLPLGRPLPGVEVYLLERGLSPVPPGVAGEVWIGGSGVTHGYLERPDLTAAVFRPHPFPPHGERGARLYRTGDLARHRADGALEFLGRADTQVKIRGFRVEPGEIEAALAALPEVAEASVLVRSDLTADAGDRRLVAYVVAAAGAEPDPALLKAALAARLPDYLVPAAFVVLEKMPLTPGGKLDRRALPRPLLEAAGASYAAPVGEVEEALASLWRDLLGVERAGRGDNFFDLGGHSLLATQLVARLRERFGVALPLRRVFETPTLAGVAAAVVEERQRGASTAAPGAAATRVPAGGRLPLSFGQERLWFLDQLQLGLPIYNMPSSLDLEGALDPRALEGAFTWLVARHETLRTRFANPDGVPYQEILSPSPFPVPLADLSALPEGVREAEAEHLAAAEARRPFDLARGPLLSTLLLRLSPRHHRLAVTMHHIVSDGWSMGILTTELSAAYTALAAGHLPELPPLPLQYAAFALWQRGWLAGEALEAQLAFWREALGGELPVLDLPADRPRQATETQRGVRRLLAVEPATAAALAEVARRSGATLFMVLLATFDILLLRLTGERDLPVGTPVAGRRERDLEGLIGLFINTLVLRNDLSGDPLFPELLERVRQTTLAALAHQDAPFERLVEELRPERQLARTPLFQVLFGLQNAPTGEATAVGEGEEGLAMSGREAYGGMARFDLSVSLSDSPAGLLGWWEAKADLVDGTTLERWVRHYRHLLGEIAADPGRRLSALPVLSDAERHQLGAEWNDTATACPFSPCLPELLAAQAARAPEAVALSFEGSEVRYGELEMAAGVLAAYLRTLGVGPEVLVGVAAERSLEMVVALLAVLKAGGAYVPLDPTYPPERLAFMLEDSEVGVLLAQGEVADRLPPHRARVVRLDDPAILQSGLAPLTASVLPENAAYAIYTSGSTGRPKGAVNAHRGLLNRILWMQEAFGLTAADVVLQKTPISFDVSVWELFWPLLVGARMVLARPGGHQEPEYLAGLVVEERVTTVHFVPSILAAFVGAPGAAAGNALRRIVTSGEALPPGLARWASEVLKAPVYNLYGPTEAAVDVSWQLFDPARHEHSVPIGRPIANLTLPVFDRDANLVPLGAPGELHIGGAGLARGYLHRPDLTAERFVPDPAGWGERLYCTGDLARILHDGTLDYLGRADHQIKIRGVRIELGEVEDALGRVPGVGAAAALARPDGRGEPRLVGYVVPAAGATLPDDLSGHLRRELRAWLPEAMIPASFVRLSAFPLTPSGKLDRRSLPAPEEAPRTYVAPRTETEALLAGLWQEVLQLDRVGAHDDFFDLGGHSLLATRVLAAVRDRFGIELVLRNLFEATTVAGVAALIEGQKAAVAAGGDQDDLEELAAELAGLSDEEVEALLAEEGEGTVP